MSKLYFRHAAMGAGKSAALLVALYQYEGTALLVKPSIDTRHGAKTVWSRIPGLTRDADFVVDYNDVDTLPGLAIMSAGCIFVDEAQFLSPKQVEQLSVVSFSVPVICYGLRTDYRGKLFPGSASLLALADVIEDIKSVCKLCKNGRATRNLKLETKSNEKEKAKVELGADDQYIGVCSSCFFKERVKQELKNGPTSKYEIYTYSEIILS